MKKHIFDIRQLLLLTLIFAWACGGGSGTSTVDAPQVMIVATGNVNGEIAPCG